ncbi:MAG: hypothetical protein A2Y17_02775 [Clostridiales bacterium GWF2_38_85]|nr:MAG: hypothetical protein A2Y17_02775 [Clostridiales bacterium GWF2_38_85]
MNYEQALKYIHGISWRGSRLGLSRTIELLEYMNNPQNKLKFIHIAGTNGKGSVSAMLASVLKEAGYKTGLYTSPYIVRFNERMQIDGVNISDDELAEITEYVSQYADKMLDPPTEFELITAVAFEYFKRNDCDIVVLETGMGGELDSTNVISTPEIAVITTIGYDHTRELGSTMELIAKAKAGIIKKNSNVVFYGENNDALKVIQKKCNARNATLKVPDFNKIKLISHTIEKLLFDFEQYKNVEISLVGEYQLKNAALVIKIVNELQNKGWKIDESAVYRGMFFAKWPARFEVLLKSPLFIFDGGHNPQGIESTIQSFQLHFPNKKAIFLIGIMADKNIENMLELIVPYAKEIITVTPDNPRSLPADKLKERIMKYDITVNDALSVADGVKNVIVNSKNDDVILAIGSLYMYREVSEAIKNEK